MGPQNTDSSAFNEPELSSDDVPSYQFNILNDLPDEVNDEIDAYELLPQLGEDINDLPDIQDYSSLEDDGEDDDDNEEISKQTTSDSLNDDQQMRNESINLDEERIEKIKSLMSGFSLPKSSYPIWASAVPEEQWKRFVDAKIEDQSSNADEM